MENADVKIVLVPLESDDREQFIIDNQRAFKYGAQEEFGMRDDRVEEGQEVISRKTIERCIDGNQAETYRIVCDGNVVGGLILQVDQQNAKGELEILFVHPEAHSKGIGKAAWKAVEEIHPEIRVWETMTPYFEKRNIHFYVNRLGFHAVEFFNEHHPDPHMPEQFDQEDGLFRFEKRMAD